MNHSATLLAPPPGTGILEALGPAATGPFIALARELEGARERLAGASLERLSAESPDPAPDAELPAFLEALLTAELAAFRRGVGPGERAPVEASAVRAFLRSAGLRAPSAAVRVLQRVLWEFWFDLVERARAEVAVRDELLGLGASFFAGWGSLLAEHLAETYRCDLERHGEDAGSRRARAVRALLAGGEPDGLDLDLGLHHLGAVVFGEDPEAAARELAARLDRALLLVSVPGEEGCRWVWLSGCRVPGASEERAIAALRPQGARIALGLPGRGAEGFRATHRQALCARRLARAEGPAILSYRDVFVEAMALGHPEDARAFLAAELRGIDEDTPACERIRETLAAYFASGSNAACAGASLGIHQQTVANRLRSAEQRLGCDSIGARRLELELAIRLRGRLAAER